MSKKITRKDGSFSLFSSRAFYITLTVCAIGIVCAIYYSINTTLKSLNEPFEKIQNGGKKDWTQTEQNANKNQSQVPIKIQNGSSTSSSSSSSQQKQLTSQPNTSESKTPQAHYSNLFIMPLAGEIINPFSKGELVKSKTLNDWRTHNGIDIKGNVGAEIKSAGDGKVVGIVDDPLWGVVVTVDHFNGIEAKYMGLGKNVAIKKGQTLKVGDLIGAVSETAQIEIALEPHLHLEMTKDGVYIDPLSIIK